MNTAIEKQKAIEWSVASRPMAGQTISGDLHVVEPFDGGFLLAVIDGVGHGDEAHTVAEVAADVMRKSAGEPVISLVKRCHEALGKTRGAVMTLAAVDIPGNTVTWMGVG